MSRIVIIGIVCSVMMAVGAPALAQDAAKVERGMKLYQEQKCSMCHSIEGKGNKKGPLDGVGSKLSADEIKQWLADPKTMTEKTKAERKPPMKAYASLSADDTAALVAYVQSLKGK